ncbi:MAG: ADOP family duplicated permease [Bryobacteraceae bacterium]
MTWGDLFLRLRALVFHARVEKDLEDEVDFHLAMAARKHVAAGHSEGEATRLARLDFGWIGHAKEECRCVRGIQRLETTLQDVRYALRTFTRSRGFVFTVVATIAVGLGLNTALFTLFNAYVLRPLSVRDPYSLYSFTWRNRAGGEHAFSWREYQELEKANPAFSEIAAVRPLYTRLDGRSSQGRLVSGNYFQMLGVRPALGRVLAPDDAAVPGRNPVLVLSYSAWQTQFGSRPDIVGIKIRVRGYPMQVVGVAQRGFQDLGDAPSEFWAPLTMAGRLEDGPDLFGAENPERLMIVGRINYGRSVAGVKAALLALGRQMTSQLPDDKKAANILLQSKATAIPLTSELLVFFIPLVAAFGLVLLLACTNIANAMLARAMARQREVGIRLALGAVRTRLIRQFLTESILLSIAAAVLGLGLSQMIIRAALQAMFATLPQDMLELIHPVHLPLDWRVFAFMASAAVIATVFFGLAPAIQASRGEVMLATRGEFTSDLRSGRLRHGLVIAQITACTLLLIVCGALVRTTFSVSTFDIGFHTHGVIALKVVERDRIHVVETLASDTGTETVAAASSIPLGGPVPSITASRQDHSAFSTEHNYVSPEYFRILGIPIVRGRDFTSAEATSGIPVAIVSAAAAQRFFGNANALGQVIRLPGNPARNVRIIGVAADIVTCCIPYGKDAALLYLPTVPSKPTRSLLVRVRGNVEVEKRRLSAKLEAWAPGAVDDIHSLDQYLAVAIYPFRAASSIAFAVGALALLLTVSGVYGVLSYLVTQRTKEIGVRLALGATTGSVTNLVLRQSLRLAMTGIALGVPLAIVFYRVLASQMILMRVFDLLAFIAGIFVVASAALAAAYIPSRRAARIDPIQTLRYD